MARGWRASGVAAAPRSRAAGAPAMLSLKDTLWIRQLLIDLGVFSPGPTSTWCDSKSAVALALDPVAFKNTKHIMRAAEFLAATRNYLRQASQNLGKYDLSRLCN
jgi:hypothetical protein